MTQTTLPTQNQAWSGGATFYIGVLVIICFAIISGINLGIGAGFIAATQGIPAEEVQAASEAIAETLAMDGDYNSINYVICFLILTPCLFFFAKKRKTTTTRAYLGFAQLPSKKDFLNYTLILIGYLAFAYVASYVFNIEMPATMIEMYQSTDYMWVSLFAVVLCAPLFEETFFRGFLFKGWQDTRLGTVGTILLTSILFTLIHTGQYDWAVLSILFTFALILGIARFKTKSIYIPLYLHFINNLYSSIEIYFYMN